jgi:hypothetical protein
MGMFLFIVFVESWAGQKLQMLQNVSPFLLWLAVAHPTTVKV